MTIGRSPRLTHRSGKSVVTDPPSRVSLSLPPTQPNGWLEDWMNRVSDLARLKDAHPMFDAVIDEVDVRRIRIGDQWLADFASCNYLGLDWNQEVIEAIPDYIRRWGTHPSWSRLLGSPVVYEEIEARLATLLGSEDVLLLPTITHIHMSVIPLLASAGVVFLDQRAHKTIFDGCSVARGNGAAIHRFRHNDIQHSNSSLKSALPFSAGHSQRRGQFDDRQRSRHP